MEIIEFKEEYKDQVIDLILKIQQDEFKVNITLNDQPDLNEITHHYAGENGNFWVALDVDKVIGTIALVNLQNENIALKKMFVEASFRGNKIGVGANLINTLLSYCKSEKKKAIFLGTTDKFKAAHRFYEKNGFHKINKNELPKDFPIVDVDTIFYKKTIYGE